MVYVGGGWKDGVFRVGRVEEWFSLWERWKNCFPCRDGGKMVFRVAKVEEWSSVWGRGRMVFRVERVEEWFSV